MFIRVDKKLLCEAVFPALCAVSSKSTIAATECLFLKADEEENTLTITGYDINKGLKTKIEATVLTGGSILLPGYYFSQLIKNMPDGEISISSDESFLTTISGKKSNIEISGMSSLSFPTLPELSGDRSFVLAQSELRNMINHVIFSYSQTNEAKPVLTGINFKLENEKLSLCSCDGYRISYCENKILKGNELKESFIVPGKTIVELLKLIDDSDEPIKIELGRKHIIFSFGELIFFSRLIDGEYVDFARTVPKVFKTYVTVNKSDLIGAIERVSLVIDERIKSPVKVTVNSDFIEINCLTAQGKAREEVSADIEGEEMLIGFNHKYLLDALRGSRLSEGDEVMISLASPVMGIVIKPTESDEFMYMVLPVRLN